MHRRVTIARVRKGSVELADRFSDSTTVLVAAAVVDAGHRLPDESLHEQLHDALGHQPPRAGDCVAPRTVHEAILEGRRCALELG